MIDINAIVNAVIATAVAEATRPLVERINVLEKHLMQAHTFERNTDVTVPVDVAADALNTQEWFWEKINNYVDARIEKAVDQAIDEHNNNSNHKDDHDIENMIDEAIDRHERNNTHGTADESVRDAIQEVLDGARVTLRF